MAGLERHPGAAAVTGQLYELATERLISGGFFLRRQVRIQPAPLSEEDEEVFGAELTVEDYGRGYKLSPLLWEKIAKNLSAGRVQSVSVMLIVDREREIRAFEPKEYWKIEQLLKADGGEFTVHLKKRDGKLFEPGSEAETNEVVAELKTAGDSTPKERQPMAKSTIRERLLYRFDNYVARGPRRF